MRDGLNKDCFCGSCSGETHLIKNAGVYLGRVTTFVISDREAAVA